MNILEEAASLVDGDRGADYGPPDEDFGAVTAAAKALGIDPMNGGPLHHALYMVVVKLRRLVVTPGHHDSQVDGAGYFYTYSKIWNKNVPQPRVFKYEGGVRYEHVRGKWWRVCED